MRPGSFQWYDAEWRPIDTGSNDMDWPDEAWTRETKVGGRKLLIHTDTIIVISQPGEEFAYLICWRQ